MRLAEIFCDLAVDLEPLPDAATVEQLLADAEHDCFVGATLKLAIRYRWRVNGELREPAGAPDGNASAGAGACRDRSDCSAAQYRGLELWRVRTGGRRRVTSPSGTRGTRPDLVRRPWATPSVYTSSSVPTVAPRSTVQKSSAVVSEV